MLFYPLLKPVEKVTNPARKFAANRGENNERYHAGEDHSAKTGDWLLSPCHGVVRSQGWATRGPNNYKSRAVVVSCYEDATALMAPATLVAKEGEHVQAGQPIALVDSYSGLDNATHVHLQVYAASHHAPLGKKLTQWYKNGQKPATLRNPAHSFRSSLPAIIGSSVAGYFYG